jgi:hypothetical protein
MTMHTMKPWVARIAITALAFTAVACSSEHFTYAPDGRRGYVVTCEGYLNDFANCLVKAGRVCGNRGYETLSGGPDDRSLLIACKVPQ